MVPLRIPLHGDKLRIAQPYLTGPVQHQPELDVPGLVGYRQGQVIRLPVYRPLDYAQARAVYNSVREVEPGLLGNVLRT